MYFGTLLPLTVERFRRSASPDAKCQYQCHHVRVFRRTGSFLRGLESGMPGDQLPPSLLNGRSHYTPSVDPLNIPFQILEPHLSRIIDLLPAKLVPNFVQYMRRGWFFLDISASHKRYGPIIAFATPKGLHVYVGYAKAVHDMFMRRLDVMRPIENYSKCLLELLLRNLANA
jgi:hypothetical protein